LLLKYNLLASRISNSPNGQIGTVVEKLRYYEKFEPTNISSEKETQIRSRVFAYSAVLCKDYYQISRQDVMRNVNKLYQAFTSKELKQHQLPYH